MDEATETMSKVIFPVSLVDGPVFPDLHATTTPLITLPLPLIDVSVLE